MLSTFLNILSAVVSSKVPGGSIVTPMKTGSIPYGPSTLSGGHDHRYNKGKDRTQAQKAADKAKKK